MGSVALNLFQAVKSGLLGEFAATVLFNVVFFGAISLDAILGGGRRH